MPQTGTTLGHFHSYEDSQDRTETPDGSPLGHTHSIPKGGDWTGTTDGHRHILVDRLLLERRERMASTFAALAQEPVEKVREDY